MKLIVHRSVLLLIAVFVLGGCTNRLSGNPDFDATAFQDIIETLAAPEMEGRDAGSQGLEKARDYVVGHLKDAGLKPAFVIDGKPSYTQPFDLPIGVDKDGEPIIAVVENIGAILPGVGDLAEEVVVVGGHYDHVGFGDIGARDKNRKGELHPGADDNASGTAGVVLLARHFAETADDETPRRTILFTGFAGEERGLHGSRYMVYHPEQWVFGKDKAVAMLNMDMVGRLRNDELYLFGDTSGKQWREWTNQANKRVGLALKWDVRPPGGSDHSLFIAAGVPAIFFNTRIHPDYHTPDDTPDKINAEGGAKVLSLVALLIERAATTDERLVYVKPQRPKPRPYLGARLEAGDGGVLIAEVPEGPLRKAGAKPGDVMLTIAGEKMTRPGDVRAYLGKASSGDEVVVVVRRGEQTHELKVRLDLRR